ncbi:hypothetical protein ERJ75_001031200 [Trypanosoma vivax]|nr:hypothetical protein ERJ75_001031200 [Trypanosoma vivax]
MRRHCHQQVDGHRPLAADTVELALQELNKAPQLRTDANNIGAAVTASAAAAECRLLAIAASGQAGNGGLLLKDTGSAGEKQNTVQLGTFVKITALSGGSASFDKTQNLAESMNIENALQAITNTKAALERHKAFACSENTCPALGEAKQTLRRTVAAIQHAAERSKNAQDAERTARERTETQIKARTASAERTEGTTSTGTHRKRANRIHSKRRIERRAFRCNLSSSGRRGNNTLRAATGRKALTPRERLHTPRKTTPN